MTTVQAQPEAITARLEYAKSGRLRFIGHLDVVRLLGRALRMAGLPARLTQGYSPHLDVSFGPPLPVGYTADAELFDVRLTEPVDPAAARAALQAHVPDGIEVRSVRLIGGKAQPLSVWLDRADYTAWLPAGVAIGADAVERFLASERVTVVRRRRGGLEKEVNVRPYIERFKAVAGPGEATTVEMTIVITPEGSTSPTEVLGALTGRDVALQPGVRLHRRRLYRAAGDAGAAA